MSLIFGVLMLGAFLYALPSILTLIGAAFGVVIIGAQALVLGVLKVFRLL